MKKKLKKLRQTESPKEKPDEMTERIRKIDADILIEIREGIVNNIPKYVPLSEEAKTLGCSRLIRSALQRASENLITFNEGQAYPEEFVNSYDDSEDDADGDESEEVEYVG